MNASAGLLPWLLLLTWFAPTAEAEAPSSETTACAGVFPLDAERKRLMIVRATSPKDGPSFDEIWISIPESDSRGARLVRQPEGWKLRKKTDEIRLEGKNETRGPVEFRIHFARPVAPGNPRVDILLKKGRQVVAEFPNQRLEEFPLRKTREVLGLLPLPPLLTSGETVELRPPESCLIPPGGVWTLGAQPLETDPARPGVLLAPIDLELSSLDPLSVTYADPRGSTFVEVENVFNEPTVRIGPWSEENSPSLTSCGLTFSEDSTTCICGFFPETSLASELRIDGELAPPPLAVSQRSICFSLPPGPHRIEPVSGSSFPEGESLALEKLESRVTKPSGLASRQRGVLRVEILGTTQPVEVLIRNSRPFVATLEGGPVQRRQTSGGTPNALSLKVIGQQKGQTSFEVQPVVPFSHSPLVRELLRRALIRDLETVRTTFDQRSQRILASRDSAALSELAKSTEQDLLHALRYRELEPLRDFVRAEFEERIDPQIHSLYERAELGASGAGLHASLPNLVAALALANPGKKSLLDQIVRSIGTVIARLEASTESLVRDLTILSDPEGLLVSLHPKAYPSDSRDLSTRGTLENLYIGRYIYRLSDPDKAEPLVDGKSLDLLHDTRSLLCLGKKGQVKFLSEGEEDLCRKMK